MSTNRISLAVLDHASKFAVANPVPVRIETTWNNASRIEWIPLLCHSMIVISSVAHEMMQIYSLNSGLWSRRFHSPRSIQKCSAKLAPATIMKNVTIISIGGLPKNAMLSVCGEKPPVDIVLNVVHSASYTLIPLIRSATASAAESII